MLTAVLDLFEIARNSLWNDEAFAANGGPIHTLRFFAEDTPPTLYYLTLGLWLQPATSVFVARALSAAAMSVALLPSQPETVQCQRGFACEFRFVIAPLTSPEPRTYSAT